MMDAIDVVCAVITNDQGQVFIGKRKSMVSDGIWEFPGGKVENNETKEQALIREIQEELNVEIVIDAFLMDFIDSAFEPQVDSCFRCVPVQISRSGSLSLMLFTKLRDFF